MKFKYERHPARLLCGTLKPRQSWIPFFWIFAGGEALAAILALGPGAIEDRLQMFAILSFACQWIALASYAFALIFKSWTERQPWFLASWIRLLFILLSGFILLSLVYLVFEKTYDYLELSHVGLFFRLLGISAIAGSFAILFSQYDRGRMTLQAKLREAELSALQARVDPHFLFNTLNTAIALVHARPDAAEKVLLDLSDLFRASLSETQIVGLAQELELTDRYLEIEQIRFGDRLKVMRQYPESLPDVRIPSLSIQPLVENAIRHGIEPRMKGGLVVIRVDASRSKVTIEVENEHGPTDASPPRSGHRVGVAGVRARIQAATQGLGTLDTEMNDARHVARIVLPR